VNRDDDWSWPALCLLLAGGTLWAWWLRNPLDWEWWRDFATEPASWWTAALVHRSPAHGLANLLALCALAVLGVALQVPRAQAWAWAAAWPLSTLALLLFPQIGRYAGLSGVLHAGVAVLVVHCAFARAHRAWAALLGAGLAAKLLAEAAWSRPLVFEPEWGFAVATGAHLTGALAGLLCALLAYGLSWMWRMRATRAVVE
jgi:rhomboid family GlyGly-CTERM serine protease